MMTSLLMPSLLPTLTILLSLFSVIQGKIIRKDRVASKVIIKKFVRDPSEDYKTYLKDRFHLDMNKEALGYFQGYIQKVKDPKLFHLTVRLDWTTINNLNLSDRGPFAEIIYDELSWRLNSKLGIKNPNKIKPHYDLYEKLLRQYYVIENTDRYGKYTHEHLHIVCAIHPDHHAQINQQYWESVIASPRSFRFNNRPHSYLNSIHSLWIEPIDIETDFSNLEAVLDYANKSATHKELFCSFSPRIKEQTHGFRNTTLNAA
jgi:hypothetical protein